MGGCRWFFLVALLTVACQQAPAPRPAAVPLDPAQLSGETAMREVTDVVALGPRHSGTPGAEQAADYLASRLRALGCKTTVDAFIDETPRGPVTFRNVIGHIPGTHPHRLLLISHYDTKAGISEDFVGANDSGSSTGLMLAMVPALLARGTAGPEILLAFVDGEECHEAYHSHDGLHGSRRLAATLTADNQPPLRAVIVLDMIGDRALTVTLPRNSTPSLIALAFNAAADEGVRDRFRLYPGAILDDHVPFLDRGIPAIDLIDFEFGSAPGRNDYWHTPADTLDKLSPESLQAVGRVALRMLNALSAATNPLGR